MPGYIARIFKPFNLTPPPQDSGREVREMTEEEFRQNVSLPNPRNGELRHCGRPEDGAFWAAIAKRFDAPQIRLPEKLEWINSGLCRGEYRIDIFVASGLPADKQEVELTEDDFMKVELRFFIAIFDY